MNKNIMGVIALIAAIVLIAWLLIKDDRYQDYKEECDKLCTRKGKQWNGFLLFNEGDKGPGCTCDHNVTTLDKDKI